MTRDLGYEEDINNNWRIRVWILFEDDDNYSPILSKSLLNEFTLLESIKR